MLGQVYVFRVQIHRLLTCYCESWTRFGRIAISRLVRHASAAFDLYRLLEVEVIVLICRSDGIWVCQASLSQPYR
jgi:hypothetical protein